jgi:hypothetical protein
MIKQLKKKSQISAEFLMIMSFGFILLLGLVGILGTYIKDFQNKNLDKELIDFSKKFQIKIELSSKLERGIINKLEIDNFLLKRYQVVLKKGTMVITDNYSNSIKYFDIPLNLNVTINKTKIPDKTVFTFFKEDK